MTLTEISADQIRPGDVIVTEGRYGYYHMAVAEVVVKDGLVKAVGVGRFAHAVVSHETYRLYSFAPGDKVTVRR